jgi:hypothetical protein
MTKLTGSEKQIAWAIDIRTKMVELVDYKIKQLEKYNNEQCNKLIALYKNILNDIEKIENAKFFIDNRYKTAFECVPKEKYIQNNLFWIPEKNDK